MDSLAALLPQSFQVIEMEPEQKGARLLSGPIGNLAVVFRFGYIITYLKCFTTEI